MSAARSAQTAAPLYSYFSLVADDPSVQIVSDAQTWYLKQMLKGTQWEDAAAALGRGARSRPAASPGPTTIPTCRSGPVAIKNVADLYLYPNTVRAVEVTGAQVTEWLERSAGIFNQIEPGSKDAAADRPRPSRPTIST